MSFTLASDN